MQVLSPVTSIGRQTEDATSLVVSPVIYNDSFKSADVCLVDGTNLGLLAVGIPLACFYAWRLNKINKSRDEWQARQDSLPEHEKEQFTIEDLHNLGDRAPRTSASV